MAMTSVRCPVLGAHITRVTDLEGTVLRIICPEYEEETGTCRIRRIAIQGGPLTQLLERLSEDTLSSQGTLCIMRAEQA